MTCTGVLGRWCHLTDTPGIYRCALVRCATLTWTDVKYRGGRGGFGLFPSVFVSLAPLARPMGMLLVPVDCSL